MSNPISAAIATSLQESDAERVFLLLLRSSLRSHAKAGCKIFPDSPHRRLLRHDTQWDLIPNILGVCKERILNSSDDPWLTFPM